MNWICLIAVFISFVLTLSAVWAGWTHFIAPSATLTATLTALFKDEIGTVWRKPRLDLKVRLNVPDCVLMPTLVNFQRGSEVLEWRGNIYFFRLWVENTGNRPAERVQVYVQSISYEIGERKSTVSDFIPMNLRWANSIEPNRPTIFETLNPSMGKHCDFGSVSPTTNPAESPRDGMSPGQSTFNLWTEVFPNNQGHQLRPGKYLIELRVAASNVAPRTFLLRLDWSGSFEEIPETMYSRSIKLDLV